MRSFNSTLDAPAAWAADLKAEFLRDQGSGCVGQWLLSETDRVRVWSLHLRPGERIGFHRHVLDYFWTAVTPGRGLSHYQDGRAVIVDYRAGETRHLHFGPGEFMVHDLCNIGDTDLIFTTVEFLDSANSPISIPTDVRRPED